MRSECVEVRREEAQKAIEALRKSGLTPRGLRAKKIGDSVRVPVKDCAEAMNALKGFEGISCCEDVFEEGGLGLTYLDLLSGVVPEEVLKLLPRSYDIVGDVVIVKLPEGALRYGQAVGQAIAKVVKGVKAVYAAGPVEDEFRVRRLKLIYGERVAETVMKEYGLRIVVNVEKTYVNPSLSEEHRRIARAVRDGEVVADLFSGVGPFSLHIASLHKAKVFSVDKNIHAVECLLKSIIINRRSLKGDIIPVASDVLDFLPAVKDGFFDRAIMNLPLQSLKYLPPVSRVVREGGVIHLYTVSASRERASGDVDEVLRKSKVDAQVREISRVLDYAPRKYVFRVNIVKR